VAVHITLTNGASYEIEGTLDELKATLGVDGPTILRWTKPGGTQDLLVNPSQVVVAHEPLTRDVGFS
jgi:hypothetical protein